MTLLQSVHAQSFPPDKGCIELSKIFLYAVRIGDSSENYIQQLKAIDISQLKKQLATDDEKKAFWLNIYNAFIQKLLTEHPEKYKNRNTFFSKKQIIIAGISMSPDDIEHGILRRSKIKWSMGYLNKTFPPSFEKDFRVTKLDNRIHFALNCGAKSCPPIAYYDPHKINMQLELATKIYLSGEAEYKKDSHTVYLPKIMNWFRGDFGGKKGLKKFLGNYHIIDAGQQTKLRFKKYDWTLFLNNYKSQQG